MRCLPLAGTLLCAACQPDVVFITVDTLRVDHVGAFNADSPALTPHMDALAEDGVAYTQAYSPISVTGPAFCTLHTGMLPGTHGVTMNVFRGGSALSPEVETLAEHLDARGYRTAAFVSAFTLRSKLGLVQGFQRYDQAKGNRREGRKTVDRMVEWVGQEAGWLRPRFLWWHTYDPHGPLSPWGEEPTKGTWRNDPEERAHLPKYQRLYDITDPGFYATRYARAVEHTDDQVGRIVTWLKEEGRYDDALIVLTADHGETFTERSLWFDHGTTAHEEQLHVPLIVKYPSGKGAGSRTDALVGLQDLLPTVADLVGFSPGDRVDGKSLLAEDVGHALLTGESSHCKDEPVLQCDPKGPRGKMVAARDADWTLVETSTQGGRSRLRYDRTADAAERTPLDAKGAPTSLTAAVDALGEDRRTRSYPGTDEPEGASLSVEDQAEDDALRALGYRD